MRCMSVFTDAVKDLIDPSDSQIKHLALKIKHQQNRYERKRFNAALHPLITLGNYITPAMLEESYNTVRAFLTTVDNAKLGALDAQLQRSMDRIVAKDGILEWVSRGAGPEWLPMHARCIGAQDLVPRKNYAAGMTNTTETTPTLVSSWLANQLREKGIKEYFIVLCEQKLANKEGVVDKVTFARMRPERCNIDYLRSIGILDLATQKALISTHAEITKAPFIVDETDTQQRLQGSIIYSVERWRKLHFTRIPLSIALGIYEEFAAQMLKSATEQLTRYGMYFYLM